MGLIASYLLGALLAGILIVHGLSAVVFLPLAGVGVALLAHSLVASPARAIRNRRGGLRPRGEAPGSRSKQYPPWRRPQTTNSHIDMTQRLFKRASKAWAYTSPGPAARENPSIRKVPMHRAIPAALIGLTLAVSASAADAPAAPQEPLPVALVHALNKLSGGPHTGYRANHAKGILVTGTFTPDQECALPQQGSSLCRDPCRCWCASRTRRACRTFPMPARTRARTAWRSGSNCPAVARRTSSHLLEQRLPGRHARGIPAAPDSHRQQRT